MRAKEKKQKKKEAIIDKTNELTKDPITGKPIKQSRHSEQLPKQSSKEIGFKRTNTMTKAPPTLNNIERQRMKNNMQMSLAQKREEEKKTGAANKALEKQLEEAQKAEKTVKKDMAS